MAQETGRRGHPAGGLVLVTAGLWLCAGACGQPLPVSAELGVEQLGSTFFRPQLTGHADGAFYLTVNARGFVEVGPDGTLRAPFGDVGVSTPIVRRLRADGQHDWTIALPSPEDGALWFASTNPWAGDGSVVLARNGSVTKVSVAGKIVWSTSCVLWDCKNQGSLPFAVVATADGGAVFLNSTFQVVRLGADGSIRWTALAVEQLGAGCVSDNSTFGLLAEGSDGTVLVGGNVGRACEGSAPRIWEMAILRFDPSGKYLGARTAERLDDQGSTRISTLGVAPDGSILVTGGYGGKVDFDDGPGTEVHAAGDAARDEGSGFVMSLRPDLSVRVFSADDHRFESMASTLEGGFVAYEHRAVVGKGERVDPFVVKLDGNLAPAGTMRLGDMEMELFDIAVAGDRLGVVGSGWLNGMFLARYLL